MLDMITFPIALIVSMFIGLWIAKKIRKYDIDSLNMLYSSLILVVVYMIVGYFGLGPNTSMILGIILGFVGIWLFLVKYKKIDKCDTNKFLMFSLLFFLIFAIIILALMIYVPIGLDAAKAA